MKKRILAVVLSMCILFAMVTVANAAGNYSVSVDTDIVKTARICPGGYIINDTVAEPETSGDVFSTDWEVKLVGSTEWVVYQGQALTEDYDGASIRFVARSPESTTVAYSNECVLIVKHNPTGNYLYSGSYHWRLCADCDGKAGEELHSFFGETGVSNGKESACTVCGAHRTAQWTGLATFFEWIFALIQSLIG